MTQNTWIENGLVIDPANNREGIGDVFIKDGLIVDKLSDSEKKKAVHFDAKGLVVAPGLVDIHVHFVSQDRPTRKTLLVVQERPQQVVILP